MSADHGVSCKSAFCKRGKKGFMLKGKGTIQNLSPFPLTLFPTNAQKSIAIFLINIAIFLINITMFLINIAMFFINIAMFLINIAMFLINITMFLINIAMFLINIAMFLIEIKAIAKKNRYKLKIKRNYLY
ncbi:hypothetical protein [Nostoc sp. DedQUE09]|uniref:hypothetical protein n=1 Tax=Nostoc sp. DedQUE09 TaxID=3075394 RepID=UPI002AD2B2E1|nr:hypothetical protein [Nostoc sp. DedQUE09]MDZ7953099.1 hypothetical protein [Nostoc sp. DedQUE09]